MADSQEWAAVCFGKLVVNVVRWGEASRIQIQKPRDLCAFKALNGKQVHEVQSRTTQCVTVGGSWGWGWKDKLAINFANKSFNYINLTRQIWAWFRFIFLSRLIRTNQSEIALIWEKASGLTWGTATVPYGVDRVRQLKIISKAGICAHFATLGGRHKILSYYAHKRLK